MAGGLGHPIGDNRLQVNFEMAKLPPQIYEYADRQTVQQGMVGKHLPQSGRGSQAHRSRPVHRRTKMMRVPTTTSEDSIVWWLVRTVAASKAPGQGSVPTAMGVAIVTEILPARRRLVPLDIASARTRDTTRDGVGHPR